MIHRIAFPAPELVTILDVDESRRNHKGSNNGGERWFVTGFPPERPYIARIMTSDNRRCFDEFAHCIASDARYRSSGGKSNAENARRESRQGQESKRQDTSQPFLGFWNVWADCLVVDPSREHKTSCDLRKGSLLEHLHDELVSHTDDYQGYVLR